MSLRLSQNLDEEYSGQSDANDGVLIDSVTAHDVVINPPTGAIGLDLHRCSDLKIVELSADNIQERLVTDNNARKEKKRAKNKAWKEAKNKVAKLEISEK